MSKRLGIVVGLCLLGSGIALAQPAKPTLAGAMADHAPLAEKVVGKSLNVKPGEIVQIFTTPPDLALAEELAVAVRKRGAFPLITVESEALTRKLIAGVPEQYDAQAPKLALALAKVVDARIMIQGNFDPSIEASVPAARRAARAKAFAPVAAASMKRNIRSVELGNGLTPSPWRAAELGVTAAELAKIYWDGLNADFTAVEEKAKAVRATLAAGGELHVTHPNGTDLKLKIKGRKVLSSDGVLSDADVKAGGANVMTWLPAGEVYVTPVPGSVQGKIVDDRVLIDGKEVVGFTAEVKAGKVTTITATSGWDAVKGRYDAAGPGKSELSLFDLGVNASVKSGGKLETFIGAGTVTLGLGGNVWAGGANKEPFTLVLHLNGATVTLDGKPLVEAGVLK